MHNNEGNNSSHNHTRTRRKKDPKSMTIEELEEYIKRNRSSTNKTSNESKSLNNSFQCLNTFNFIDNTNNTNTTSHHNRKDKSEERGNVSTVSLQVKTDSNEENDSKSINSAHLLFKELASPFNINPNPANNKKNTKEQFEEKKTEYSQSPNITAAFNNTNNNPITNLNSKAASSYLKTLQNKINQQAIENDELKRNFVSISELYEKEKERNNKMLYYESNNNNSNTINKSTESLSQFNTNSKEKDELVLKINMQANNILLLEKEKMRHLEKNSIEKGEYETRIAELNKKCQLMEKDNESINSELIQLRDINEEANKFKKHFEEERSEMIEAMKSLREIIFQKENEKNALANQYGSIIQELNEKIDQMTHSNKNVNISQMDNSNNAFYSIKKSKTNHHSDANDNIKQRNKTKDKQIPTKLNNINSNNIQTSSSSSSSLSSAKIIKKKKRQQKTPKRKNSKQHYNKTSIPIKSMPNSNNKSNNLQYHRPQPQEQYQYQHQMAPNNQNALFKPGELSSIRSNYECNNDTNKANSSNNNWMSGREERMNDYEEQLNQINESIFALERNLPEITRDYKNILSRLNSKLFPEESITLKNNLNLLGATIEEHNNQLIQLKSQQQDILKDYLSQGGNLN